MTSSNFFKSIFLLPLLLHTGCSRHYLLSSQEAAQQHISPTAIKYFNTAFQQVSSQSYRKKEIDFKQLYLLSLQQMQNADSCRDTYAAIKFLIAGLSDRHSFFQAPPRSGSSVLGALSSQPGSIPFHSSIIAGYGWLELKSYNAIDTYDRHRIADSLYAALKKMDQENVKALIIDFRKMEGGSTVPFLTAFAPLINQDILLKYVDNNGHASYITRYKNGIYTKSGSKTTRLGYLTDFAPLQLSGKPIALITGNYTASAGEMILIAFLGLPNVKTFGAPTYGVATGKSNIFLADSAFISLATTVTCDRNGNAYTKPVNPQQNVPPDASEAQLLKAIQEWIK